MAIAFRRLIVVFVGLVTVSWGARFAVAGDDALAIFQRRILPIMRSPKPSSCTECHLASVELADYIEPSQQKTFASLVAAGLIDTDKPEESKLLTFIRRAPEKPSLITKEIREQELAAFTAWIKAAVDDPQLLAAKDAAEPIGPSVPDEVVRHGRADRVLASFVDNVWSEVGRCAACHSPKNNQRQVEKWGERVSWISPDDPQGTLDYMVHADLIDIDDPAASLLLVKPTMQVKHGGGKKAEVGDRTYKQFRTFIEDYAATVKGEYKEASELPQRSDEVARVSTTWLRLTGVPEKFDKLLLQVDVYAWTDAGWSPRRVATSDRAIFGPKNLWQNALSLTAPRGSRRAEQIAPAKPAEQRLRPGKYLVKLYLDRAGKCAQDYTHVLGDEEFYGQVEVQTRWTPGYNSATVVKFPAAR